jgi:hypothetical protein
MALLECSESFLAFRSLLRDSVTGLLPSAHFLLDEYCRYALDRAWFYFPQELPAEAVAKEARSGRIDRSLAFPLEDLYLDGSEAGQVGQEVYGAGAAFIFAAGAFHRIDGAPFEIFADSLVLGWERPSERAARLTLGGSPEGRARVLLRPKGRGMPRVTLTLAGGRQRRGRAANGGIEHSLPANASFTLAW